MIRINLLADRQAKDRRLIQQQLQLAMFAMVVVMVICAGWLVMKDSEISAVEAKITSAQADKKKLEGTKKRVEEMEARQKQVEAILKTISELTAIKAGPTPYLDNLNDVLPTGVWLTDLDDNTGAIRLVGFSIAPQTVAEFMTKLAASGKFTAVDLKGTEAVTIQLKAGGGKPVSKDVQKFTITCMTLLGKQMADEKQKQSDDAAKKAGVAAPKK